MIPGTETAIVKRITEICCRFFGVDFGQICSGTKTKAAFSIAHLCRIWTNLSWPEIAAYFGKPHSTFFTAATKYGLLEVKDRYALEWEVERLGIGVRR